LYDVCYKDDGEEDEEQDSGFLGSMLEAQLVRDGNELCKVCGKPIRSILNAENPNLCEEKEHKDFKRLFEVRCKIGLHDLKTRGYD
jgi:hypothetical protein